MVQKNGLNGVRVPHDPRLPQLALALDARAITPFLPLPGFLDRSACSVAYIRYKPGTSCLVLYHVPQPDRSPFWIYAKIRARGCTPPKTVSHRLFHYNSHLGMTFALFPYDQRMPALRMAASQEAGRILTRVVPSRKRDPFLAYWSSWKPVRYKPERRCVLQGQYQKPQNGRGTSDYYARFYAGPEVTTTAAWHRHFSLLNERPVKTPHLIGFSERHKVLLVDALKGSPLHSFLTDPEADLEGALRLTAEALALWHRLPAPSEAPRLRASDDEIRGCARFVSALLPEASELASLLSEQLVCQVPAPAGPSVLIHGDFYYDQVMLRQNGRVGFLDLDELAVGRPTHDLATFCAHLQALAIRGDIKHQASQRAIKCFVETYHKSAANPVSERLFWWDMSVALLKQAPMPFRRLDPDWDSQVQALLKSACAAARRAKCS